MSKKMKYIIFDKYDVIMFPEYWDHAETAYGFQGKTPTSAGFCNLYNDGVCAYGESVSLRLKSNKDDSLIINKQLGNED